MNSQGPIAKFLLRSENPEELQALQAGLAAEYNPQTSVEHSYLADMALARVRMLRYAEFEASLIDTALDEKRSELGPAAPLTKIQADAMRGLIDHSKTLNTLQRYQQNYARAFDRAAAKLAAAKAERQQQYIQERRAQSQIEQRRVERELHAIHTAPLPRTSPEEFEEIRRKRKPIRIR